MAQFLKSRYYPVSVTDKIIYMDPQKTEGACALNSPVYRTRDTIGIKGERLNKYPCYIHFRVRRALGGAKR